MKVKELIDILFKCSPESEVNLVIAGEGFDYPSHIVEILEITDKLTDETSMYITHN